MNEIKVLISFEKRINRIIGVDLTSGDYNSTKLIFEFDRQDGTKIFELKNPKGELVFVKEIENNEITLARVNEDGTYSSLFDMSGDYIFEVSLYTEDSKLTSEYEILPVEAEQVVIGDEVVEPYLPIFDELIQKINTAINEASKLDMDIINDKLKDYYTKEETQRYMDATIPSMIEMGIDDLENLLRDILTAIQSGISTSMIIEEIEQLIVSYFETKTVEEVEA